MSGEFQVFKPKINKRRARFILIYFIFVTLTLIIFNQYTSNVIRNQMFDYRDEIAQQNQTIILNRLNDKLDKLSTLAEEFSQEKYDITKMLEYTENLSSLLGFREIGIAMTDGNIYTNTGDVYDISNRDYFKHSINGEKYISGTLEDMGDGAQINVFCVPIWTKDNEIKAALGGTVLSKEFADSFQTPILQNGSYSYIIDGQGNIISEKIIQDFGATNLFDALAKYPGNEQAIKEIQTALENQTKTVVYGNIVTYRYATLTPIDMNDWVLVTSVPEGVVKEKIADVARAVHFINIAIILASTIILLIIISKQRKTEQYLKTIAYIDPLTGLYNRSYFRNYLFIHNKSAANKKAALVIFNIGKFKVINDIYGEKQGDELLKSFAAVLKNSIICDKEMVMREVADEFAALYFYTTNEELEDRVYEIIKKMSVLVLGENKVNIELAVGICEINDITSPFDQIYDSANIAKKKHKTTRNNRWEYYSRELGEAEVFEKQLIDDIKDGIRRKEFKPWFQPKFDIQTGKMIGAEALVRWYQRDGRIVSPSYFIEFSEKSGLIYEVDKLIIHEVCKKISEWRQAGDSVIPISINLSRAYLNNIDSILQIKAILDQYDIPSKYIQLEITESAIVDNEKSLTKIVEVMHKLGFKVLLDDFGVGYSSLVSIKDLNFDILKIDKSFVDAIGTEKGNHIIKYTIELGKSLGMDIVVEGVETEEQYTYLKTLDCDFAQGYYLSKPLPNETFEELLSK